MSIESLYRRVREGHREAETQLFQHLSDRFRLFVQQRIRNREDSEDVVQQALATIAEKHGAVDFQISFAGWAYKVLEHKVMDYFKTERTRQKHFGSLPDSDCHSRSTDLDPIVRQHMLQCLTEVARANRRFARILNLSYQGYGSDEICDKLQLNKAYYYVVLSRARSMLENCLTKGERRHHE
ncbi:MAG TPA: sigma-70 family RNA polymerase sigma factor [Acidobacteriota bacterium]|nr:sigma-70 family RNA polymerase sigma factor [Acidobacteriota bacterium]